MGDFKGTPGPWRNSLIGSTHGPDGEAIQTAGAGYHGERAEEYKANARLIAAAPDLLAACEAFVSMCRNLGFDTPSMPDFEKTVYERGILAIRKAKVNQ